MYVAKRIETLVCIKQDDVWFIILYIFQNKNLPLSGIKTGFKNNLYPMWYKLFLFIIFIPEKVYLWIQ